MMYYNGFAELMKSYRLRTHVLVARFDAELGNKPVYPSGPEVTTLVHVSRRGPFVCTHLNHTPVPDSGSGGPGSLTVLAANITEPSGQGTVVPRRPRLDIRLSIEADGQALTTWRGGGSTSIPAVFGSWVPNFNNIDHIWSIMELGAHPYFLDQPLILAPGARLEVGLTPTGADPHTGADINSALYFFFAGYYLEQRAGVPLSARADLP